MNSTAATRLATAVLIGSAATLVVLFVMQALVTSPQSRLDRDGVRHFVDFVRVDRTEELQRKERHREKPRTPEAPPPDVVRPRTDAVDPAGAAVVPVPAPAAMEMDLDVAGLGLVASDGDYLPIVKIAPAYPMAARNRGLEGHCLVEYTVTPAGTVKNVVVVESEPRGIFDRVSIEAALKFKYRPRVVNGEPIEVRGVRNLFRYVLEQ